MSETDTVCPSLSPMFGVKFNCGPLLPPPKEIGADAAGWGGSVASMEQLPTVQVNGLPLTVMLWCTVKERGPPMKLPLPSVGAGTLVVGSQPEPLHSWRV